MKSISQIPSVGFVSLGCPKATSDSELILTRLRAEGYRIVGDYAGSDLVIVNTCGFIDSAVEESLDAIGEALAENGRVIVTGCLGAREEVIRAAHPSVLAVTGPHDADAVLAAVHARLPQVHDARFDLVPPQGIRLTPPHYAWLKISEGCNHHCTFCIIPSLRGDLVSRPIGEVMAEAERLAEAGVKEILVVSQDTGAYGVDLRYRTGFWQGRPLKTRLADLAQALSTLGLWIRMHYVYPYPHVDALIPLMAEGKILPYLDIPFQHASPRILRAMARPAASEDTLARIRAWREICPELVIRSTFITGFPGETEDDFAQLLHFVEAAQIDRLGCFTYSPVEGAAANALPDPVPLALAEERRAQLMTLQADISAERLAARVGETVTVLVDEVGEEGAIARSYGEAPEIDGVIVVEDPQQAEPGEWLQVRITDSGEHDLWGEIVS